MTSAGRVVVTGAGGWLGGAIVASLASSTHSRVVGLRRQDADLAISGSLRPWLEDPLRTTVIHMAASLDRDTTPEADDRQWRDTFTAGREVIRTSVAAGVRHLIVAGSMEELGDVEGVIGTAATGHPASTYGLCKALLRDVAEFEALRRPVLIDWFRPTVVYGPGQRGSMLVPYACHAARLGHAAAVTDGTQVRDFLFIDDLLAWVSLALRTKARVPEDGDDGSLVVHHLGTGRPVSVAHVLDRIESSFQGARFIRGARPRRPHEPATQVAAVGGPTLGGWTAVVPWEIGIDRTIAWWRQDA